MAGIELFVVNDRNLALVHIFAGANRLGRLSRPPMLHRGEVVLARAMGRVPLASTNGLRDSVYRFRRRGKLAQF
jgi:hypothetical protein